VNPAASAHQAVPKTETMEDWSRTDERPWRICHWRGHGGVFGHVRGHTHVA
jgi:hypothetical protein